MFRSYCKTAVRNLIKNRTFSIINLTGLSISTAFCLLLFFYIRHEQSYDTFHANGSRLFRLEKTNMWSDPGKETAKGFFSFLDEKTNSLDNDILNSLIVGPDMKNTFPEVKNIVRYNRNEQLVRANKVVYNEKNILYADQSFLESLSFPLLKGNIHTVLSSSNDIVISETVAKKYFGGSDAIGKTIELVKDSVFFRITGIAQDAPLNSSIQYSVILPLQSDPEYALNIKERFNRSSHLLLIELKEGVSTAAFEQKINRWATAYFDDYFKYFKDFNRNNFHVYLRPLADCHYNVSNPWGHFTDSKNIYQLSCFVIVILLIASLNYVLLTVSNLAARTQEVGIRKVMGANRKSVILQFWMETQLLVLAAVLTGLFLSALCLPLFNSVMNTTVKIELFSWNELLLVLVGLAFILGVLAGYYPALLVSKLKPVSIIKSFRTFKINPRFSRILVVTQYTGCVVLMIVAFVINRQMHYISDKSLGFDKEQVLMVKNPTWDFDFTKKLRERLGNFAQSQPDIALYSGMNGGLDGSYNTNGFMLNGEQTSRKRLTVDYDYFEMLGLKFVQGRPFSKSIASDTSSVIRAAIVNETLFKMLGASAKLGVYNEALDETVIGVVKDYNIESLSKKIEPTDHVLGTKYLSMFLFKIKPGKMKEAITKIENEWKADTGNYPFEYTFLDESIAKIYEPEMRWQRIIQASCFFAIFIACMGLFGLSAINAINRTKEIGIRKVLGANVKDIVAGLSSSFVVMILISIAIATPLAWWMMNKWLQDFAYRINISWWMFAITGIAALLIALGAVSYHAIKAATANPVQSLRTE